MPVLDSQANLLRELQQQVVHFVGGDGGPTDRGDLPQAADVTGEGAGRRDPRCLHCKSP